MKKEEFFELAQSKNIKNLQVTEETVEEIEINISNDKIDNQVITSIISYEIKAEINNKTVKLTSDYLDSNIIDLLLEKAKNTESVYEDIYLTDITSNNEINTFKEFDNNDLISRIINSNKLGKNNLNVKNIEVILDQKYIKKRIYNTNGVDKSSEQTRIFFYVDVLAEKNTINNAYRKLTLDTKENNINIENIIEETIKYAVLGLEKNKLETKKYDILLTPKLTSKIISKVAEMLEYSKIRQNKSYLVDKLNTKFFSDKINIIEDPTNSDYPGYSLFDDEGTNTYKKYIVKNGVIENYLYNNKEALLNNTKSTGNGYSGLTRNMYLEKGMKSYQELIEEMKDGIIVTDSMGATGNSINTINGEISIQIFGFIVKNGKIISGIIPAIMTTNFKEILNNIKEIGNDLDFESISCGTPSILVEDISIAA